MHTTFREQQPNVFNYLSSLFVGVYSAVTALLSVTKCKPVDYNITKVAAKSSIHQFKLVNWKPTCETYQI